MITGRMSFGNFVYAFGIVGSPLDMRTLRYVKKRRRIVDEFEKYARRAKLVGEEAYGAIFCFPTESGARQWLNAKTTPVRPDMTLAATPMGTARITRVVGSTTESPDPFTTDTWSKWTGGAS